MSRDLTQLELLQELQPVAEENVNRHLSMAKDWHPHDYVPWDEGRNFAAMGGEDWDPEQSRLDEVAKAAMITNLLTEDNLPSYHREIAENFSQDGAWGTWVGRWTAEENRHGIVMRDYLVVTRGVDPVELENARMVHMTNGYTAPGWDAGLMFEETTSTLLCGDFFTAFGRSMSETDHDIVEPTLDAEDRGHATALTPALGATLRGLAELEPAVLGLMHGPAYRGACSVALRELAAAYDDRLDAELQRVRG